MIPNGSFTQIIMLVLAVGIVFTYIKPAFSVIGETQDDIAVYRSEREKVSGVNATLQQKLDKMLAIPAQDRVALLNYIPDTVDSVAVPRDIQTMAELAGLVLRSVASTPVLNKEPSNNIDATTPYAFAVSVEGSYDQIKAFLRFIERNNYPLDVQTLTMQPLEGGFMSASLQLVTHGHLVVNEGTAPVSRRR